MLVNNIYRNSYRTKASVDLRLSAAESILVLALVVDCSDYSGHNEDPGETVECR